MKKTEYSWNAEGELNQVSHEYVKDPSLPQLPDQSLKFKYDENGNRIKKEVDGKTRYYINEGNTVLNELDENGEVVRTMVRGLEPVAEIEGDGTIRYLHQDALGSTVMETGSNGEVVREYDYDVYGGMLGLAGGTGAGLEQYNSEGTRYLYTDQEFDSESNLYYYNARYYNPSTGRFLSRDPILGQPGNVLSNNPYIYVQNNPLKFTDPTGMWTKAEWNAWGFGYEMSYNNSIANSINQYALSNITPEPLSILLPSGGACYEVNQCTQSSPKASISKSTSGKTGNPSGSKNSFKQEQEVSNTEIAISILSTLLEYAVDYGIDKLDAHIKEKQEELYTAGDILTFGQFSKAYDKAKGAADLIIAEGWNTTTALNLLGQVLEGSVGMGGGALATGMTVGEGAVALNGIKSLIPLGLGSTGRTIAKNLTEELAMKEIMSNPNLGKVIVDTITDARWNGWSKMSNKTAHGVEIHYNALLENGVIKAIDDFKFINP